MKKFTAEFFRSTLKKFSLSMMVQQFRFFRNMSRFVERKEN